MESFFNELDNLIMLVGEDGLIEFCNNKLLLKLNYQLDEIIRQPIEMILSTDIKEIYVEKNYSSEKTYNLLCKYGQKLKVHVKVKFIDNNNTRKKVLILKESIEERDIIDKISDNIPFIIWVKDLNGVYRYVNREFTNLRGLPKSEVIGKCYREIWKQYEIAKFEDLDKCVRNNKKVYFNEEAFVSENSVRHFNTYRIPLLNETGDVEYILGVSEEVTLSRNLNIQVKNSYERFAKLQEVMCNSDTDDITMLLENIKEDLISYLHSDGVSIWLYDQENQIIKPYLKSGTSKEVLGNIDEIHVDGEKFKHYLRDEYCEKIKEINEYAQIYNRKRVKDIGVKYIGIYKIKLQDKILGVLCTSYKNFVKEEPQYEHIKNICSQLAVLIKNNKLSLKLNKEFEEKSNAENELQYFLDTAADLMGIIGKDYYIKRVNGRWSSLLGWSNEELLSMKISSILYEDDIEEMHKVSLKMREQDKSTKGEIVSRIRCKNGQIKYIKWYSRFIEDEEVFIITGKDITEQRLVKNRNKEIEKALQLESIKNQFFANMSHEFKTPLNIILAAIQLINKFIESNRVSVDDDIDFNKYIKSIRQNSYRLLRLANNLIDISKIDSGHYKINLENNNIVNIVEEITMSVAQYIENKGMNLVFDTEIEEMIIACDPEKIERIMLNLLSNSVKYSKSKNGNIYVKIKNDDDYIIISVEDNGLGISPEKINIIFERFIQSDDTLTRKCEGSGIGLSLVKSLVEMHDGTIDVVSEIGEGTEFIFKLPIRVINNDNDTNIVHEELRNNVEKCNIEFSDIYNM